tara:strand:+ start:5381 stop:6064 length:684 start_codon:yes stop_codon:yes gene_type:complete
LKRIQDQYVFKFFTDDIYQESVCLLRHDVDFSLESAINVAEIEYEMGVKSTFFIYPHCRFYNIFWERNRDIVSRIIACGHRIGLHFDSQFYSIANTVSFEKYLEIEAQMLEKVFDISIKTFSFHRTDDFILRSTKERYANLISATSKKIKGVFNYISDSNGHWRFKSMDNFLKENHKNIHVLTHPGWWTYDEITPRAKIESIMEENRKIILADYINAVNQHNRLDIK